MNNEAIEKVKKALRRGDQPEIARVTGFSRPWVNQVLNCKRGATSEDVQRAVIDAALDIIAKRLNREKKTAEKYMKKTNDLLG